MEPATSAAAFAEAIRAAVRSLDINGTAAHLVETAVRRGEAALDAHGALVVSSAPHTGRAARDKYIRADAATAQRVWWTSNQAMPADRFAVLEADFLAYARGRNLFAQHLGAGVGGPRPIGVSVFTETAWHALFISHLLAAPAGTRAGGPQITILHLPGFRADPARHGVRSSAVVALDLSRNVVLIGGTAYAGEIKKAVFTVFCFHAPQEDVLPMHCAANLGPDGRTALFFGLSGTGKTTLSTDPDRCLVGDDEHGWTADGIFNLEGGCYAKTAKLSEDAEPQIFRATRRFGTVLENVAVDGATRLPDFHDLSATENGRTAYPLSAVEGTGPAGAGHPADVILLSADAFGVLPPVARLTRGQALYYFVSGYTAKVAGTEQALAEPVATFSACFGAPFMSQHPRVYGELFARRLEETGARCWLVNTGWMGGAYGAGYRVPLRVTRRIVGAVLAGELDGQETVEDTAFGLRVPTHVDGVPDAMLQPRASWLDAAAYDRQARRLVDLFEANLRTLGDLGEAGAQEPLAAAQ